MFKELPLYLWQPSAPEVAVIRDWLLNYSLTAVKNKLACVILEGLNWGFAEQVSQSRETGFYMHHFQKNVFLKH